MKKRIRNAAVAIGGVVSAGVVGTLSIVAFLGRFVGTFTVSLDTGNVALALSDSSTFERQETFLRIDTLPGYHETTYTDLPEDSFLDNEANGYLSGANLSLEGEVESLNYFKYTFFVKNVGDMVARYRLKINVIESKPSKDGRFLDDTLRVMLYGNAEETSHEKTVYAKRRAIAYEPKDAETIYREPISITEDKVDALHPFQGYAEMFESSDVIATFDVSNFGVGEMKRYTLVTWLEGYDPQSSHLEDAPEGATIKLGVEINAYEN